MSTTVTNSSGVQTRQKARSNSETLGPMRELAGAIDILSAKRRGTTKRTLPARTSPDVEEVPTSPLEEVFSDSESTPTQIWNEVLRGNIFLKLTKISEYIRKVISYKNVAFWTLSTTFILRSAP